jgi:succinate dehydrogenase hydrophobic anchor subunit
MSPGLRAGVFSVSALLWASGIAWLVLHLAFEPRNEFGALPHPWEATLMRVHGLLAVAGVFLLGWLGAGHVLERWRRSRNRTSGWVLLGCAVLLVLSGYALYYCVGPLHTGSAWVHEWLGAATIIVALMHWLRIRTP